MDRDKYIEIANNKFSNINSKNIIIKQINNYYDLKSIEFDNYSRYNIGDEVILKKGTLLHGTYKNIAGLKDILRDGLISSYFINSRMAKYPSAIGVWNLGKDYKLVDYINFYSGGTIKYFNHNDNTYKNEVVSYSDMNKIMDRVISNGFLAWNMEQTKEARFLPSLVQNKVQIGIIFNGNLDEANELLKGDILNPLYINDDDVCEFVNDSYYSRFIVDRKNKDVFFTDRESAILFGVPSNLIEGILVGRDYENDKKILDEIKKLLPNCYICNLDGVVIVGNI